VQVSHTFTPQSAVFDEDNLVSCAGLVPVMALAEQAGLSELLANKIDIAAPRVKSGSANPAPKLATLIASMCAGADYIDDVDLVRAGGMKTLFHRVYAPSTVGTLLREFTFGHARQLDSVLAEHLAGLCERVDLLPGAQARAFIDIDSLVRPVYGHHKQGASYGHTKIAGKQVLRKGLSPLVTTISTDTAAPLVTGIRLRAGKSNSGKGAARMVAQAITTARAAGVSGLITVRGDSAYGNRAVIRVCRRHGAVFSLVLARNTAVQRAIDAIHQDAWTPVQYPGAVRDPDPDTGAWISDAEVAETTYTMAESGTGSITARLVVRRVKDATIPPTACSRSGAITRFSPTPPSLPPTPISPTAATRSSNPPSPISSTGPWPTSLLGASAPIPRGRSARPSRIICCARPRRHPAPSPGQRPRPPGPTSTQTHPAPTHPLALGARLDHPVAQHHRPTIQRLTTTHPTRQPGPRQERLGRPAVHLHPPPARIKIKNSTHQHRVYRWNQDYQQF
jgi:hypothetical protein